MVVNCSELIVVVVSTAWVIAPFGVTARVGTPQPRNPTRTTDTTQHRPSNPADHWSPVNLA